ncbi:MAG TPA: DUF1905 domain-containing protein [Frankiaceae bacterium]|nr:DUF1905 domain-containing protein [Frankiaceae bacterium]
MEFEAELWQHEGEGGWCFVTLPAAAAEEVREQAPPPTGFGAVRVAVVVGESRWQTSLFPDKKRGSYLLPVKQQVRRANDLLPGDRVRVSLTVASVPPSASRT